MTDDELRDAVAASRSWRGVLRVAGRSSPRYGRELRARCDDLGISYEHFRAGPSDDVVVAAVSNASTWDEAVTAAGYAESSGSARAQLQKRCSALGVSTEHLVRRFPDPGGERAWASPTWEHLRDAGPTIIASRLLMAGYRVSWPLEPCAYDLVVESPRGMQRVQVKTTTRRESGSWLCSLKRSLYDAAAGYCVTGFYSAGEIDAFGVVDGDLDAYLIPFGLLEGRGSVLVRGFEAYRLAASPNAGERIR